MSSCVSSTLWLIRISLPPSVDAEASSRRRNRPRPLQQKSLLSARHTASPASASSAQSPHGSHRQTQIAIVNSRCAATSISPITAIFPSSACAKLPRHLHVRAQVLIAVARPHIPARRPAEPAVRSHRQRPSRPSTPAGSACPPHRSTAPSSPRPPPFRCGASSA